MIGSNSATIISDAFQKGVKGMDTDLLFEAMLKNATVGDGRPVNSVGRAGLEYYNTIGYVPSDIDMKGNVARTLEYAFADFTIAKMAEKLGKKDIANKYFKQSLNYKNVFDPSSNLMRGKKKNGDFQSPFNPLEWSRDFTEGNSLHYTWSVLHDIQGLINLMGGNEKFIAKLDTVFTTPAVLDPSIRIIHEMREMQVVNMGNYAHGNQPIQHMIYLYNYANVPYKTQFHVRDVLKKLYSAKPDGYCGDEDNGQTSAWYIFSSLGFYPVTPGVNQYVIGSPLFKKATIHLKNGNIFQINSKNNSDNNVYVHSIKLNGKSYNNTYLNFEDIENGGELQFNMDSKPNKNWGSKSENVPYSLSNSNAFLKE